MSHFPVLVVVPDGKTLEDVLMPYHEFECTGIDLHIQNVDITEKVIEAAGSDSLEAGLSYYGLEDRTVKNESDVNLSGAHKYGYAVVRDGKLIKAVDRTNPNNHWDWWTIGGRWSGFLGIDSGTKSQFDFERVRLRNIEKKLIRISTFQEKRREVSITSGDIDQSIGLLSGHWKDNRAAQELYTHPVDLALDSATFKALNWYLWSADTAKEMRLSAEQYTAAHGYDALTDAFIDINGNWNEIGRMGWFAMCDDENKDTFNGQHGAFWTFINALPDDAMLYLVDCHI